MAARVHLAVLFLVSVTLSSTECQVLQAPFQTAGVANTLGSWGVGGGGGSQNYYGYGYPGLYQPNVGYIPTGYFPPATYSYGLQPQPYPYTPGLGIGGVGVGVGPWPNAGRPEIVDKGSVSVDVNTAPQPPSTTVVEIDKPVPVPVERPGPGIMHPDNDLIKHVEYYGWGRNLPVAARSALPPPFSEHLNAPSRRHIKMPFRVDKPWHQEVYAYFK